MKKKIIDKQILSALAIGIGAGIMLTPVTAEAADNEGNDSDPDGNTATNNDDTTTAAVDTVQAQEYSEAHEAAEADVQEARKSLVDAAADVNAVAIEGNKHSEAYESVSDAITAADDKVYDASQNLKYTENVAETVDSLITDAQEKDNSLQEKADTAASAYDAPTNTANEAAGKVENIDVETTSLEEAEAAVTEAEKLLDKAEQEKTAADALLDAAEAAATEADSAISAIEDAIAENEAELTAAKENLESAEQDLLAAKETMDSTKPTADEKNRVNNSYMHFVIKDIEDLSNMSETDEGYKEKLDNLYNKILDEYVLHEFDFPTRSDYDLGKFSFEYSFKDGVLTITLPALEEGFYTSKMVRLVEDQDENNKTVYIVKTEDENYVYAIDTSDKSTFIESKSSDYVTVEREPGATEWFEYEMNEGAEEIVYKVLDRHQEQDAQGNGRDSDTITLHKQAQFTKYKCTVKAKTVPETFKDYTAIAKALAEGYFDTLEQEMYNSGNDVSLYTDIDPTGRWPGYSINGNGEDGYTVTMHFLIKENSGETATLTATETYWAPLYQHTNGYDELTYSTDKGNIKKAIDAQKNAEAAIEKAEKAVADYNTAIEKVTEAKASVDALQEKGEALFSELRDKADKKVPNNVYAHSRLSIAQAAKQTAETAIENAKQAIVNAATKVNLINERIKKAKAENEGGTASGDGSGSNNGNSTNSNSGTGTNGGSGSSNDGGSGSNVADDGGTDVTPTINNVSTNIAPAVPTTIPSSTPVLAIGTDMRAAVLAANKTQFYKNLSEELTRQLLEQKNAVKETVIKEPGDMVKDVTVAPANSEVSIEEAETPLAETPAGKAPTPPLVIIGLLAIAGISVEEYYRRKAKNK